MKRYVVPMLLLLVACPKAPPCQQIPVPTATAVPIPTVTATAVPTPVPTATAVPTPVPTATAVPTAKPTPKATATPAPVINLQWDPVPQEDEINGDNNNSYNAAINHPTPQEAQKFVDEISAYAIKHALPAGVPASVVVAMAANESGFGFTRVGSQANSIFSQKNWGCGWKSRYSNSCYSLVGQPDEWDGQIKIIKKTAKGVIYDEATRPDNKYFGFATREDAVKSLVQEWLVEGQFPPHQKGKYTQTITNYKENISKGMSRYDAAIFFIRQLADLGYMHLGGEVYVQHLKPIMDKYNLVKLDGANVEPPFAGWTTYITDERRQTQQLPNQMYALMPNATKKEWAYVFCPWWGNANVPSEPKNILLFANYTGFQDKNVYPDWAQERHNRSLDCLETVFKTRAKIQNIFLQTTQGDSTNADFSLKIRTLVQAKQDALTAKYGVKQATITYGADEQAVVGMAYSLGQATPVDIIVSNPLAKQHYDGDRTAQELIAAKMHDLGMVQVKGAELKILVITRRPGAENTDFQTNDIEQAKFDADFFAKNPVTANTIIIDTRLYNGAWDINSVPKFCNYLTYSAWGTFQNAFGSGAAIGKILYKMNASPDVKKQLLLEAVAHDAIFQGYNEVQRNPAFHALLKSGGGISPYDHWNDYPWDVANKSYVVMNNYVNKRMQEHFSGTDCMTGKTIKLTPQRPALFEAISEVK